MQLGIDIGGTHTDGVLIDKKEIINSAKIPTQQDLTTTILTNCQNLTKDIDPQQIKQVTLSTTLATNIIAQQNYPQVGLILIPGPGLDSTAYNYSPHTEIISGSINHRGQEVKKIDQQEVKQAVQKLRTADITNLGVCGKFSTRNPQQELEIKELIEHHFPKIKKINLSHHLSGKLNFPRRVATTYLTCIVQTKHQQFVTAIQEGLEQLGITAPIKLLKADGGTMPLKQSQKQPMQSINSGPAASIMGILALNKPQQTTLALDIGGTTTDISLFINQEPLFKPQGIEVNNYKTSIRGLYNSSLACGGDSLVQIKEGTLRVGPQRKGPAAALGGKYPTPTDALVVLDNLTIGDKQAAKNVLKPLANQLNLTISQIAHKIITKFCNQVHDKIKEIIATLQHQPVYTINELLTNHKIEPNHLVGIGGPAKALIPKLANQLNLDYTIPAHSQVANAIGAAKAKITKKCILYADTAKGYYTIPNLGIQENINHNFNLDKAQQITKTALQNSLNQPQEIEITNKQSFNIVRRFNTLGKIIEVTAQVKPGIESA